jgi:hypothetical protein
VASNFFLLSKREKAVPDFRQARLVKTNFDQALW